MRATCRPRARHGLPERGRPGDRRGRSHPRQPLARSNGSGLDAARDPGGKPGFRAATLTSFLDGPKDLPLGSSKRRALVSVGPVSTATLKPATIVGPYMPKSFPTSLGIRNAFKDLE